MEANFTERVSFKAQMEEVVEVEKIVEVVTSDHTKLQNRDEPDQHPISAITGLQEALANAGGKADPEEVARIVEAYLAENPPAPGKDGEPGEDGISPTVTVEEIDGGHRITITDATGTQSFDVMDGKDGSGEPGTGEPGEDGVSPTVEITEIEGGTRVTITDAEGEKSFDVMNGRDGQPGSDGHTPVKGEDYFTDEDIADVAQQAAALVPPAEIEQMDAEKVIFSEDLLTTTAIGNIKLTNGQATIPAAGKNLKQVWETIFVKEKNPATTQPSVSLTCSQAKAYEVGSVITPEYKATLKAGSYTYGPATGITATSWLVTDTAGHTSENASGSFPEVLVDDSMNYEITATATHGDGTIPVTNLGNEYPDGQIKAGSKSAKTSMAISGYRNSFYGTLEEKGEITSDVIRGLTSSGAALADGDSFDVPIPVGAMCVVIAYPATLRDVSSIKDVNGMSAEISSSFTPETVQVEGANGHAAIDYKVYTLEFANANDAENTFAVTI